MTTAARADAMRPAGRPMRLARSLSVALVCVAAAAVAHHTAGGAMSAEGVIAVFGGSAGVAWLLSARRVTPGQLVGLLVLCQTGVHLAASSTEMSMDAGMLVGHLVATAVSAIVLARGERFVWQLAERLGLRLAPLLHVTAPFVGGRPSLPARSSRTLRDACLTYSRSLRGPPVGTA